MSGKGVVSLVNFLGDDKITFQVVHNAMTGKITTKKGETTFSMVTEEKNLSAGDIVKGKTKKIGLVLWVDADDYAVWHSKA